MDGAMYDAKPAGTTGAISTRTVYPLRGITGVFFNQGSVKKCKMGYGEQSGGGVMRGRVEPMCRKAGGKGRIKRLKQKNSKERN